MSVFWAYVSLFIFMMGIDVSLYLSHLLYRNNVAILPGFGAFVATTTPALIDHARGYLMPPSKVLTFNDNLKINDGFLINLIRHKHGITAHEARIVVDNFVQSIQDILKNKDTVRLDSIGKLYLNNNDQVIFEPDTKANFNANTFGLPSVQYYALSRNNTAATTTTSPYIKPSAKPIITPTVTATIEKPVAEVETPVIAATTETKTSTWLGGRKYLAAAAVIGLMATAALWQYKKPSNNDAAEAKVIPTSDVRVNVGPDGKTKDAENTEKQDSLKLYEEALLAQQEAETKARQEAKAKTLPSIKEETLPNTKTDVTPPVVNGKKYVSTLLIGSFSSLRNAKKAERRLRRRGYTTYNKTFNGLRRVGAIVHYNTDAEKNRYVARLHKIFGDTVWELEK